MPLWYRLASTIGTFLFRIVPARKGKWLAIKEGQSRIWDNLATYKAQYEQKPIWYHCASLGEFEQAKPVLLALRERHPEVPVVVTFFSPSGYEARKTFPHAEWISYLPLDNPTNASRWLKELDPRAVFWVKYEFWLSYLEAVKKQSIPLYLLAALPKEKYFKGLKASYYTQAYGYFDILFLQYPELKAILPQSLRSKALVTGDPRYDNVLAGVTVATPVEELKVYSLDSAKPILLVGSAWKTDMEVLLPALSALGNPYRLLVFPHEMNLDFLKYLKERCPGKVSFWSQEIDYEGDTLIVDKVGFLARSYAYADVAWVGGGFDKGLHNILEAAAWGKPVLHGPQTAYFPEAARLGQAGGGYTIDTIEKAILVLRALLDKTQRSKAALASRSFVETQAGATARILAEVDNLA